LKGLKESFDAVAPSLVPASIFITNWVVGYSQRHEYLPAVLSAQLLSALLSIADALQ
jgi:hypothetical protein